MTVDRAGISPSDAVPDRADPAELFDIEMDEFTRMLAFITPDRFSWLQGTELVQPKPPQNPADGGWRDAGLGGDLLAGQALTTQPFNLQSDGGQLGRRNAPSLINAGLLPAVQSDLGAFRTPSLRNVAVTAPYMHDGSLATLEDVIDFYDAGGRPNPFQSPFIKPLYLDDYERAALVAFLRTLTDQQFEHLASEDSGR